MAATKKKIGPCDAGWPRPKAPWRHEGGYTANRCPELPDRLPVPWINGPCIEKDGDWHSFREDAQKAHHERLCVVCGEPLGKVIALGAMHGDKVTAGPGGHPRCIWLAANTCPHLVEQHDDEATIAWVYKGPDVGYICDDLDLDWGGGEEIDSSARPLKLAELKELARSNPLGH
jgi:hypothetical protein